MKKMKKFLTQAIVLLLTAGVLTLSACAGKGAGKTTAQFPDAATTPQPQDLMNTVRMLDSRMARRVSYEYPYVKRNSDGTLQVNLMLRNVSSSPVAVEGRTRFYSVDRCLSDGPTEWRRVILPAHSFGVYQESSTKKSEAAYYYVELREAF
jgi:hypothetical protein